MESPDAHESKNLESFAKHPWTRHIAIVALSLLGFVGVQKWVTPEQHKTDLAAVETAVVAKTDLAGQLIQSKLDHLIAKIDGFEPFIELARNLKTEIEKHNLRIKRLEESAASEYDRDYTMWRDDYQDYQKRRRATQ